MACSIVSTPNSLEPTTTFAIFSRSPIGTISALLMQFLSVQPEYDRLHVWFCHIIGALYFLNCRGYDLEFLEYLGDGFFITAFNSQFVRYAPLVNRETWPTGN